MANRYWVGGTGTWDATAGSKWSTTDGGSGGSAVPTSADTVFITSRGAPNWTATTALSLGAIRCPATTATGYYYEVTTAGTTGNTEPTWPTTPGVTVASGSVTFTCRLATVTLGTSPTVTSANCNGFIGTLAFGTNKIVVTATAGACFTQSAGMTVTGTPVVDMTPNPTTGNMTITTATPTEANSISYNVTVGTGTVTIPGSVRSLNFTGFTGTLASSARTIYGSLTLSSGMTVATSASTTTFAATSGTNVITTNGKILTFPLTFSGVGGSWQQNTATTTTGAVIHTGGTLNLNNLNFTCASFNCTGTNTRAISFGTGQMFSATAGGTVLTVSGSGLTVTGSGIFNSTYSGATGTRAVSLTAAADSFNINVTAGTDIFNVIGGCGDLNFTGFSGSLMNTAKTISGSLTASAGMTFTAGAAAISFTATSGTKTITSAGKTFDFPITFNGSGGTWQLVDALTVGSTRTTTLTAGTIDLNNNNLTTGFFSTNVSTVRGITTGTGNIYATGSNGTVVNLNTVTNFTLTGTLNFYCTYSGSVGTRTLSGFGTTINSNYYITAGTDVLTLTGNRIYNNIDFTGFTGTISSTGTGGASIYGNFTGPTSGNINGSIPLIFIGTKTITTNALVYDIPMQFGQGSSGGIFTFTHELVLGTTNGNLTFANGTIKLKDGTYNGVLSFTTTGTTLKYLQSTTPGVQANIYSSLGIGVTVTYLSITDSAASAATWDATDASNVNGGNNTGWTFSGGGTTYLQNVNYTSTSVFVYQNQVNKRISYTEANTTVINKGLIKRISYTETNTSVINKGLTKPITATETSTVTVKKGMFKSLINNVVNATTLTAIKLKSVLLNATSAITTAIVKAISTTKTYNSTTTSTIKKAISIVKSIASTITTTLTRVNLFNKVLNTLTTNTALMIKQVLKLNSILSTSLSSLVKSISTIKSIISTVITVLIAPRLYRIALSILSTISVILVTPKAITLTAIVSSTASIVKQVSKLITTIQTTIVTISKSVRKQLTKLVTSTVTLLRAKTLIKTITATVTSVTSIVRQVGKELTSIVSSINSIIKAVAKSVSTNVTSILQIVGELVLTYGAVAKDTFIVQPRDRLIKVVKSTEVLVRDSKRSMSIIKSRIILLFRNPNGR